MKAQHGQHHFVHFFPFRGYSTEHRLNVIQSIIMFPGSYGMLVAILPLT